MSQERQAYKQYEAGMIQLLRWRFEKSNLRVEDHLKVGELPLEIDLVVKVMEPEWIPDFSKFPKIFGYFQQHTIIEVKSEQDEFEVADLPKLLAYGWHYMAKHGLENVPEVTLTALVHHLAPKTQEALQKFGFKLQEPGVFRRDADMKAYVVSITDLLDEFVPEELCAFADPKDDSRFYSLVLATRKNRRLLKQFLTCTKAKQEKLCSISEKSR
jgi:hypothetical protein